MPVVEEIGEFDVPAHPLVQVPRAPLSSRKGATLRRHASLSPVCMNRKWLSSSA